MEEISKPLSSDYHRTGSIEPLRALSPPLSCYVSSQQYEVSALVGLASRELSLRRRPCLGPFSFTLSLAVRPLHHPLRFPTYVFLLV